jgi:hypothetical protein
LRVEDFQPALFIAAAEKVAVRHTDRQSVPRKDPPSTEVDALRSALLGRPEEQIPPFALGLKPRQLHAAVILLTDGQVGDKATEVLRCRPRASLFRLVWGRVRRQYPERRLTEALDMLGKQCGWEEVTRDFSPGDHIRTWFASDGELASGAAREWESDHFDPGCPIDVWLEECGIPSGEAFHTATISEFLTKAKGSSLQAIDPRSYLSLLANQPTGIRAKAMVRYLNELQGRGQWDRVVLERFHDWFHLPQPGDGQNTHWSPVNPKSRSDFRAWYLARHIKEYFASFADEKGRAEFWLEFVKEEAVVQVEPRCQVPGSAKFLAMGIEFRDFGVVEFGQVGNAAYIYPISAYREIVTSRSDQEWAFKDRNRTIGKIGREKVDGRLEHHEGWQRKWRPRITRLIGERRR